MSYFPVSLYISVFTTTISTPLSASIVLALFNSSGVVGQIIIGYLTDRMPYPQIMVVSTVGSSAAAFLLWGFADSLGRVFAFAIIFGGLVSALPETHTIQQQSDAIPFCFLGRWIFFSDLSRILRVGRGEPRASPNGHIRCIRLERDRRVRWTYPVWNTARSREVCCLRWEIREVWLRACGDICGDVCGSHIGLESDCRSNATAVEHRVKRYVQSIDESLYLRS